MNSATRDDPNDTATNETNALRPRSLRHDPSEPVDIGCGVLRPIRSSAFGSILEYAHDVVHAPSRVDEKLFEFDCLVITTRSHWEFRGRAGRSDIDERSLTLGVAGDTYGCRHHRGCADGNLVVALRAGALDLDYPAVFSKQVVPAQSARRLANSAVNATTADAFDSLVFTLFDEASICVDGPPCGRLVAAHAACEAVHRTPRLREARDRGYRVGSGALALQRAAAVSRRDGRARRTRTC